VITRLAFLAIVSSILSACVTPSMGGVEDLTECKKGYQATQSGRHSAAVDLYNSCIKHGNLTEPSLSRTYRNIGIANRRMKKPKVAIEYFNKSLSYDPFDKQHDYINRGNSWSDLGQYQNALADYTKALSIAPKEGAAVFNRGIVYERLGQIDKAVKDFYLATRLRYGSLELLMAINRNAHHFKKLKESN